MNRSIGRFLALATVLVVAGCDANVSTPTPAATTVQPTATDRTYPTAPAYSFTPDATLEAELRAAGLPDELAGPYSSVTTEVVTNEPGHYRYRQQLPAQHLVREVELQLTQATLEIPDDAVTLVTTRGMQLYPLLLKASPIEGGYLLQTMFYVPPGELTDEELVLLAPQPASAAARGVQLAAFNGVAAPGSGGVVASSGVAVADASGGADLGGTLAPSAESASVQAAQARFWENIDVMDDYYNDLESTQTWLREQDFANRGIEWQENELRLARESAADSAVNRFAAGALAIWELYNGVRDWWNADDELNSLSDCNNNSTNPLHRDQSEIDATNERIDDVRNELRVNNAIRGGNIAVTYIAGRIPGPLGAAALMLSSGGDRMLSEDQGHIMSGLSQGIVSCTPTYLRVTVTYRYGFTFVNDPPERGLTNDKGQANEVYGATVIVPFLNGEFRKNGEWGAYRHLETGSYDCIRYFNSVAGLAAASVRGSTDGFATAAPGQPPTPTFQVNIGIKGNGLETIDRVFGFDHQGPTGPICKLQPELHGFEGTTSFGCSFEAVDVLHGGTYVDPESGSRTPRPGETETYRCQMTITPLTHEPERDPTAPAPPTPD